MAAAEAGPRGLRSDGGPPPPAAGRCPQPSRQLAFANGPSRSSPSSRPAASARRPEAAAAPSRCRQPICARAQQPQAVGRLAGQLVIVVGELADGLDAGRAPGQEHVAEGVAPWVGVGGHAPPPPAAGRPPWATAIARRKPPQSSRNEASSAGASARRSRRRLARAQWRRGRGRHRGRRPRNRRRFSSCPRHRRGVPRIASSRSSSARSRRSRSAASRAASRPYSSSARAVAPSRRSSPGSCWRIRSSARSTWASASPGGEVAGRPNGPRLQRRDPKQHLVNALRGDQCLRRLLPLHPGVSSADSSNQRHHRGGQGDRQPAPLPLLLGAGIGLDPLELGPPQPLLHAAQVGGHPLNDRPGPPRPVFALGGQAVLRQDDQLGVGPATVRAARRRRPGRLAPPSAAISAEDVPTIAGCPVRTSQRIDPRPKTSARSSTRSSSPRACSGAM